MAMALNSDNNTNIGASKSFSYSIYDENSAEISVSNQANPLDFWISKDTTVAVDPFLYVNVLNASQVSNATQASSLLNGGRFINGFFVNGLTLNGSNVSIHIQIKPTNLSMSYLSFLKFNDNPMFKANFLYYDIINLFCPNDLITQGSDTFYLIFANMAQVNGFKGYVGFSLVEIDSSSLNCQNKSLNSNETLLSLVSSAPTSFSNSSQFKNNFWLRLFTAGCYYTDPLTNQWASYGMEILSDTSITSTHCTSSHLTTFAGGFIVLPPAIDFNQVWANASFLQNPTIYSTVIALIGIYVFLAIWAGYMDRKDERKMGVTLLGDSSNVDNKYAYEIIVFTGSRPHAGTKSKVFYFLFLFFQIKIIFYKKKLSKR